MVAAAPPYDEEEEGWPYGSLYDEDWLRSAVESSAADAFGFERPHVEGLVNLAMVAC